MICAQRNKFQTLIYMWEKGSKSMITKKLCQTTLLRKLHFMFPRCQLHLSITRVQTRPFQLDKFRQTVWSNKLLFEYVDWNLGISKPCAVSRLKKSHICQPTLTWLYYPSMHSHLLYKASSS